MSFGGKVKTDYWKGEKKKQQFSWELSSESLSLKHMEELQNFIKSQVHCLATKDLITYSRKEAKKKGQVFFFVWRFSVCSFYTSLFNFLFFVFSL